jgi:L-alanine-DL-glutamate epimerase-like enolase superfamily enzyme
MKVDAVHVLTRVLPRRDKGWKTSSYKASEVVGLYVGIEVDGHLGVGASCAHPRSLAPEVMIEQATEVLLPALEGSSLETVYGRLAAITGIHSRTRLAADLALHDLFGKRADLPSEILWGGPIREHVGVIRMIGLKEPDEVADHVAAQYERGFRAFKIKIGDGGVDRDVSRLRRIREAFPDVTLTADCNGHYSLADGLSLAEQIEELDLLCLEQPLGYDDVDGMVELRASTTVPIMADQMVKSARDAARIASAGAADMISLKLTKMGSVSEAIRVVNACAAFGVQAHLGGCAGPGIVDSSLVRLALSCADIAPYAEVGESLALEDDEITGAVFSGEWARSDGRPGLGGSPTIFDG